MAGDGQARGREGRISTPRRGNEGAKPLLLRRLSLFAAILMAALVAAPSARAQAYPNRPIKLVVAVLPGGPMDVMGRLIAQHLSSTFGQVFVENRAGAGTTLGAKAVASAEPDGYTLLLGNAATLAIGPTLYKSAGYDPLTSFAPVAFLASVPYVLIVSPSLPVRTVQELVAYAKAHPGKLSFGVPNAAPPHMLAAWFKARTGTDVVRITDAPISTADEIGARQRRYLLSMGLRTLCFLGAIVVGSGWLRWVLVAAALVLPYVAVVMANAASPKVAGTLPEGPDLQRRSLPPGQSPP